MIDYKLIDNYYNNKENEKIIEYLNSLFFEHYDNSYNVQNSYLLTFENFKEFLIKIFDNQNYDLFNQIVKLIDNNLNISLNNSYIWKLQSNYLITFNEQYEIIEWFLKNDIIDNDIYIKNFLNNNNNLDKLSNLFLDYLIKNDYINELINIIKNKNINNLKIIEYIIDNSKKYINYYANFLYSLEYYDLFDKYFDDITDFYFLNQKTNYKGEYQIIGNIKHEINCYLLLKMVYKHDINRILKIAEKTKIINKSCNESSAPISENRSPLLISFMKKNMEMLDLLLSFDIEVNDYDIVMLINNKYCSCCFNEKLNKNNNLIFKMYKIILNYIKPNLNSYIKYFDNITNDEYLKYYYNLLDKDDYLLILKISKNSKLINNVLNEIINKNIEYNFNQKQKIFYYFINLDIKLISKYLISYINKFNLDINIFMSYDIKIIEMVSKLNIDEFKQFLEIGLSLEKIFFNNNIFEYVNLNKNFELSEYLLNNYQIYLSNEDNKLKLIKSKKISNDLSNKILKLTVKNEH